MQVSKKTQENKEVNDLVNDLLDPNHTNDVSGDNVPSATKKNMLSKALPGAPAAPKKPSIQGAPKLPEIKVPSATQAVQAAGEQNPVGKTMKKSMQSFLEGLRARKKTVNPDAQADQELAENVEALVENHVMANPEAEAQEKEHSLVDLYLDKSEKLSSNGHSFAARKMAEQVIKISQKTEDLNKANEIISQIPEIEPNSKEVAVAALAKAECMGKAELVKSRDKNKRVKEQKGVHKPAFMDSYESGTSDVGSRMAPGGASKQTNEWAKEQHKEKLAELKAMPKPNLTKATGGSKHTQRSEHKNLKGVHTSGGYSGLEEKGQSQAGRNIERAKEPQQNKYMNELYHGRGKELHREKLEELRSMPKPNLTKTDHQAHPGPSKSEHQKAYDAKQQAESEAKLKTPEGDAERIKSNEKRMAFHKILKGKKKNV